MPDINITPPNPSMDTNAAVLIKLGVLEEGQRNTLSGIDDIKKTLSSHGDRIGAVEVKQATLEARVDNIDSAQKEAEEDSKPAKGRLANWFSASAAVAALIIMVLNQLYLSGH